MFYGIDEPFDRKVSLARIAEKYNKSIVWIKKTKAKALQKLKQIEVKEIIEKFLEK